MSEDVFSIPSSTGFIQNPNPNPSKRKRNLPGTPDPDAEVIHMSPKSLMATNRFMCEICNKGFQRDQNLQLHRRGHNLPWKLKQRSTKEIRKKVYICPEKSCVHHDPSRALGDLTGIKKHYSRKHGEKKWKCEKCSKKYAVQSDWKAHSKICGTREYRCDCGTLFSRKDSFITHRAFCDALAEESARFTSVSSANFTSTLNPPPQQQQQPAGLISPFSGVFRPEFVGPGGSSEMLDNSCLSIDGQKAARMPIWLDQIGVFPDQLVQTPNMNVNMNMNMNMNMYGSAPSGGGGSTQAHQWMNKYGQESGFTGGPGGINSNLSMTSALSRGMIMKEEEGKLDHHHHHHVSESVTSLYSSNENHHHQQQQQLQQRTANMSATALLQKAAQMGSTRSKNNPTTTFSNVYNNNNNNNQSKNHDQQPENMNEMANLIKDHHHVPLFLSSNTHSNSSSMPMGAAINTNTKLSTQEGGGGGEAGNLTRDFLGVGGEGRRPSFFQQELANYANLDIRQYSKNTTTSSGLLIDRESI